MMTVVESNPQVSGDIALHLLGWYDRHARALPWRAPPGKEPPEPYRVWLSEIMLQQTTVAAVIPYFDRFTRRWPNVAALAAAEDSEVMAAWAGLGYYARARNLLACARAVTTQYHGQFPNSEQELLKLPGVGAYTAAAIAAIAFGSRAVVVDANVERVITRLGAIATPLPAAKAEARRQCDAITPADRAGDFAQAMMDLGATICTPRNPACRSCPISAFCAAQKAGAAAQFPVKSAKTAKPRRTGTAYWIEKDSHVWLTKRPDRGMLAGMRALPDDGWSAQQNGTAIPPIAANWQMMNACVQHVFTHFSLTLSVAVTASPSCIDALGKGEWWPVKSLDSAGLPTLFSKAAKLVSNARGYVMED
jgi:A/G-specific adenine glycosylase